MTLPPPVIREHEGFLVVRDDLMRGGTKRRVLTEIFKGIAASELVYPSTPYGYGPLSVACSAKDNGKTARLFFAARRRENWTDLMEQVEDEGAVMEFVRGGSMKTLMKRARDYAAAHPDSHLLKLGFDTEEFRDGLAALARSLPVQPREVWCASGTGTLTRAFQKAWPEAEHHAVVLKESANTGNAVRHVLKTVFAEAARDNLPPFPSASHFDAKAWHVMKQHGRPGALFWNIGA